MNALLRLGTALYVYILLFMVFFYLLTDFMSSLLGSGWAVYQLGRSASSWTSHVSLGCVQICYHGRHSRTGTAVPFITQISTGLVIFFIYQFILVAFDINESDNQHCLCESQNDSTEFVPWITKIKCSQTHDKILNDSWDMLLP